MSKKIIELADKLKSKIYSNYNAGKHTWFRTGGNAKIFAIVATLGTTVRGAIDPIKEISEICKQRNIWLHIDGSIGGIFAITSIPIDGLNNINQANSITINPQK